MALPTRAFGSSGVQLPRVGFGAMGITSFYSSSGDNAAIESEGVSAIIAYADAVAPARAFVDTAFIYAASRPGGRHNEEVVGEAVRRLGRERVFLATKGSLGADFKPDSSDAGLRAQLAISLGRLGCDHVDLFYEHRRDVGTPIEAVAATFKALAAEGKIKFAGLSECTAGELRRAHAVFPVTCVQLEYSAQERSIEAGLLVAARELGVAVVAYSPLGRGMLSATFASPASLPEDDWRRTSPRFASDAAGEANFARAASLAALAQRKGCSPAQLALAWLLSRGDDVFPIPGSKNAVRAVENARAAAITLSADEARAVEDAVPPAEGDRYAARWGQWEDRA
jgi:aryl-alcohol dehydrogenase-like predicted oxidoreductase